MKNKTVKYIFETFCFSKKASNEQERLNGIYDAMREQRRKIIALEKDLRSVKAGPKQEDHPEKPCGTCGEAHSLIRANPPLCRKCYDIEYRKKKPFKRPIGTCSQCNEQKPLAIRTAPVLCGTCYSRGRYNGAGR